MAGSYIEVCFTLPQPGSIQQDLLIAGLGEAGYESFLETETGFNAYIPRKDFSERLLREAIDEASAVSGGESASDPEATSGSEGAARDEASPGGQAAPDSEPELGSKGAAGDEAAAGEAEGFPVLAYEVRLIEARNWNQVWESHFQPVVIGDECRIRASFHEPDTSFPLEIQIDPKMSFGTGHHETTWLMASWLLELPLDKKKVLDMGCGTGVLAILAAKMGASQVLAADIDPVCVESTVDNAALNDVSLSSRLSGIDTLPENDFDVIMANINRNVLLEHLPSYAAKLIPGGTLLISGFYEGDDLEMLREKAEAAGLTLQETRSKNRWAAAGFRRLPENVN